MKRSLQLSFPDSGLFNQLAAQAISQQYGNGEAIFLQGDAANAMFRIEQGHVKLAVAPTRGKKAATFILREGDCFGECCLIANALCAGTATSIRNTTVGRISKRNMMRRLNREPAFAKLFTLYLLHRIGRVEDDFADHRMNSSEKRLARLLLQLSDFGKSVNGKPAEIHVDQATLAQATGTTRSRVSYFMNRFRSQGFIEYNGSIRVNRSLLAFLLADSEAA